MDPNQNSVYKPCPLLTSNGYNEKLFQLDDVVQGIKLLTYHKLY